MLETFQGVKYRIANNWYDSVKIEQFKERPIRYLEIGVFYGANLISVAKTYAAHPESELYAVDPWKDYSEYPEYKNEIEFVYTTFLKNIESEGVKEKIKVIRNYSHNILPTFENEFFDIIYIDGNHEPEYVLEDAVLSFRKLKPGGILIFDDYGWGGPDLTQKGIDAFLSGYSKRISKLGEADSQVFVQKLSSV
jgi:SAM-dependent methyltransferase